MSKTGSGFSTRFTRKGTLADETRLVLREWHLSASIQSNLTRILADNMVGAKTAGWLNEIRVTLSGRIASLQESEIASLVALARSNCSREVWLGCIHWHWANVDPLYFQFVTGWLFEQHRNGVFSMKSEDAQIFVEKTVACQRGAKRPLSKYGIVRAARDLFRMAADFGLLKGAMHKEFTAYHLPEESFIYLLHAMAEVKPNARRIVDARDWRMFMMDATHVERELFRLHQFRKIHYDVAGSLAQLELPHRSAADYAREL